MALVIVVTGVSPTFAMPLKAVEYRLPLDLAVAKVAVKAAGGLWRPPTELEVMALVSVATVTRVQLAAPMTMVTFDVRSLRAVGAGVNKPGYGRMFDSGPIDDVCGRLLSTATAQPEPNGHCVALATPAAALWHLREAACLSAPWLAAALWLWPQGCAGPGDVVGVTTLEGASLAMVGAAHVFNALVGHVATPMGSIARRINAAPGGVLTLHSSRPSRQDVMLTGGRCVRRCLSPGDAVIVRAVQRADVVIVMCSTPPAELPVLSRARRVATSAMLAAVVGDDGTDAGSIVAGDPGAAVDLPRCPRSVTNTYTEKRGERHAIVLAWHPVNAGCVMAALHLAAEDMPRPLHVYGDGDDLDALPRALHRARGAFAAGVCKSTVAVSISLMAAQHF